MRPLLIAVAGAASTSERPFNCACDSVAQMGRNVQFSTGKQAKWLALGVILFHADLMLEPCDHEWVEFAIEHGACVAGLHVRA